MRIKGVTQQREELTECLFGRVLRWLQQRYPQRIDGWQHPGGLRRFAAQAACLANWGRGGLLRDFPFRNAAEAAYCSCDFRPQAAPRPVPARPGTQQKLAALQRRYARGEELWHAEDGEGFSVVSGVHY